MPSLFGPWHSFCLHPPANSPMELYERPGHWLHSAPLVNLNMKVRMEKLHQPKQRNLDSVFWWLLILSPQIAIAIGVLTYNRGGGRRTTLADWTWHQGAIAGCSGRGAIAGCHCNVLWWGRGGSTNFGGVAVVPLQGAIVVCYGWGAGCQCRVPL